MSKIVKHELGQRFGHLIIMSIEGKRTSPSNRNLSWLCRCDCGKERYFKGDKLRSGRARSCGCERSENHFQKYNQDFSNPDISRAYKSWEAMLDRAHHKTKELKKIRNYQARGITVHPEWLDFNNFFKDMGPRAKGLTIGRIDNDKGYDPGNCRWETNLEQGANRRNTVFVEYEGKREALFILCKRLGVPHGVVAGRLKKRWSLEKALKKPVRRKRPNRPKTGNTKN